MQQGNEKPTNFPGRPASPFSAPPPNLTPLRSPGPLVGSGPPGAPQSPVPFSTSGPVPVSEISGYRPTLPPPVRFNGPSSPPPSPFVPQTSATYPQPQAPPRFPLTAQPVPPLQGPPMGPPSIPPSISLRPVSQIPTFPTGFLPQPANQVPARGSMPPPPLSESPFSATRPPSQTPLYGPPSSIPRANVPPIQPHFPPFQGGQVQPPPPPIGVPLAYNTREQMQYPNMGPPIGGNLQGLVEDFQSLSVGSVSGSLDSGVDPKSLPRPLDGDVEPTSILDTYPLNCHPRFFRMTTHALPSSQSLLSRWHLPLGALVHPLAEVPDGEEVPVVNFGPAGVIRCRRCRTYVNPYVTFTDAGRKWRCNLCALLNDAIENTLSNKLEDARQFIQLKIVKSLKEYRNLYVVQHRLGGRLIFPESLKFLPLYALSLCKSVALRGGFADSRVDERCAAAYSMMILPVKRLLKLLYPNLHRVDEYLTKGSDNFEETSKPLALTAQSLDPRGLYIYDDGFSFYIWFGGMLPSEITNYLVENFAIVPDLAKASLCDSEVSRKLMKILNTLREKDPSCYQLYHLVRQGEQPREGSLILSKLVEDKVSGASTYLEWILQIYRQSQDYGGQIQEGTGGSQY